MPESSHISVATPKHAAWLRQFASWLALFRSLSLSLSLSPELNKAACTYMCSCKAGGSTLLSARLLTFDTAVKHLNSVKLTSCPFCRSYLSCPSSPSCLSFPWQRSPGPPPRPAAYASCQQEAQVLVPCCCWIRRAPQAQALA